MAKRGHGQDERRTDRGGGTTGEPGAPAGRRGRRAARRAAAAATTTAGGVAAARREARFLRFSWRLARLGAAVGILGGVLWWGFERARARERGRLDVIDGATGTDGPTAVGGAAPGETGTGPDETGTATGAERELVDVRDAAGLLGVEESRIPAMVRDGMLHPAPETGAGETRFERAEVEAVRLQGG